ncbi:MAG: hypothetical protein ACKVHE_10645 [Planctomycetales bacterium]
MRISQRRLGIRAGFTQREKFASFPKEQPDEPLIAGIRKFILPFRNVNPNSGQYSKQHRCVRHYPLEKAETKFPPYDDFSDKPDAVMNALIEDHTDYRRSELIHITNHAAGW